MAGQIPAPDVALLVLNAGSSSLKAALFTQDGACLWRDQRPWHPGDQDGDAAAAAIGEDSRAVGALEQVLAGWLPAALEALQVDLLLVAHRVVHGGERFIGPTLLDPEALKALEQLVPLAPLHNGPALRVMGWVGNWRPQLPQWACFDTAFHCTLPPEASTYALPQAWRTQGLRRFGFHGLSHQHVSETVSRLYADRPRTAAQPLRLISCHLGAGCSLCAIRAGRSLDTTMGYTPMEGLVMATRSGSVDPGVLLHLLEQGLSPALLERGLQTESGLLGLSGLSADMRELRVAATAGHEGALLALAVFRHRLLAGIGAMAACLGGVDVIALTGGIGEHDDALLAELEEAVAWLRPVDLLRIAADEEGLIARSCMPHPVV
ncbi:acetate kinase [Synechococcus sp. CBW1107]|uniref:acetate/propionate family kinase n=1 Tax=Synechococcus sp. CBW1107 TaxID=2789857 RepID=UPI002AD4D5C4|nr:acetate kinase [Synechococcus sp. CBW1107]CAK6692538.1 Acetate kinase [Synechococcus sp. CBW1107]